MSEPKTIDELVAEVKAYRHALKAIHTYAFKEENAIILIKRVRTITSEVLGIPYDESDPEEPDPRKLEESIDE